VLFGDSAATVTGTNTVHTRARTAMLAAYAEVPDASTREALRRLGESLA